MSLSVLLRDFLIGELVFRIDALHNRVDERFESLTTEVRQMAQAINDRIDQLVAAVNAEKAEVAAALQALRDEIAAGKLDEAQIVSRLDGAIADVQGIHVPEVPEPPNPIV